MVFKIVSLMERGKWLTRVFLPGKDVIEVKGKDEWLALCEVKFELESEVLACEENIKFYRRKLYAVKKAYSVLLRKINIYGRDHGRF